MFKHSEVWEQVFEAEGVLLPPQLKRWAREGYSVYFEKGKLRGSPKEHQLTRVGKAWASKHVEEELIPRGAVEEVDAQRLPKGAVV